MRLCAIALLAMVVRAVVPAGYMLAAAETPSARYLTFVLCGGEGHSTVSVDLATGKIVDPSEESKSPHKQPSQPSCVFAASAAMTAPGEVARIEFVLSSTLAAELPLRDVRPVVRDRAVSPPSTGPPASA